MSKKKKYEDFDEDKIGKPSSKFFGLFAGLIGVLILLVLFFVFKDKIGQFFGF